MSLDPVLKILLPQAIEPTRYECPPNERTLRIFSTSQTWTIPEWVPIARSGCLSQKPTEVAELRIPKSHNLKD